jgi:hypothetical protein
MSIRTSDVTNVLEGVRQEGWGERDHSAPPTTTSLARQGWVSYRVISANMPNRGEKRASERRRSRLRSGKLLDQNNRFLCECLVHDRSSAGLRIKLMKNVSLPGRCRLYDDETGDVRSVATVWRRDSILGMRYFADEGAAVPQKAKAALRGRYYAMQD